MPAWAGRWADRLAERTGGGRASERADYNCPRPLVVRHGNHHNLRVSPQSPDNATQSRG